MYSNTFVYMVHNSDNKLFLVASVTKSPKDAFKQLKALETNIAAFLDKFISK